MVSFVMQFFTCLNTTAWQVYLSKYMYIHLNILKLFVCNVSPYKSENIAVVLVHQDFVEHLFNVSHDTKFPRWSIA